LRCFGVVAPFNLLLYHVNVFQLAALVHEIIIVDSVKEIVRKRIPAVPDVQRVMERFYHRIVPQIISPKGGQIKFKRSGLHQFLMGNFQRVFARFRRTGKDKIRRTRSSNKYLIFTWTTRRMEWLILATFSILF